MSAAELCSAEPLVRIPPEGTSLDAIQRLAVLEALKACDWVQSDAAKLLHISPRVIHYKIQVYDIVLPANHPNVKRYAWRRARKGRATAAVR